MVVSCSIGAGIWPSRFMRLGRSATAYLVHQETTILIHPLADFLTAGFQEQNDEIQENA